MQISDDTAKKFPKLRYYVKVNMPQVAEVNTIVNAIQKLAGKTTKETIKNALKWGQGPTITVVKDLRCAGKKAYGCYKWNSNELRIDEQLVKDFEAGKGLVTMKNGKKVYLVGVTLLHELTHWADAQDGVDDAVPGDPSNEEGEAYEKAVYGDVLG